MGEYGEPVRSDKPHGNGPAEYYDFPGFKGSVGFISALSKAFCDSCNRVRLTADGVLKPCLCYSEGLNLKSLLRGGVSDEELRKAIEEAILSKPLQHSFCEGSGASEVRKMVQIGG
jgi:cyclic pyranopterin phosphate synthase